MATDVPMPKLGLTMEEATIIEWLVADGAEVEADAPIVLIETDKTETEVGSPGAGRLAQFGRAGDVFKCGERIAVLLAEGEAAPVAAAPAAAVPTPQVPVAAVVPLAVTAAPVASTGGRVFASPNARRVAAERGVSLAGIRGSGPGGRIVSEDLDGVAPAAAQAVAPSSNALTVATFAARSLADLLGVDLALVAPDPVERMVTRDGVARYVRERLAIPAAPAATPPAATPVADVAPLLQTPTRVVRMSGMRGTIAKRMQASLREMAQLTLTMDAPAGAVLADRAERKTAGGSVPSITDYIVAATARALVRHPLANAQITADGVALLPDVHVGLAVAVDGGLFVPVVRDAAHRSLADLAAETTRLAAAARSGKLSPADLEGGTFSVSALGAFGVDAFTPVINPPNVGILGVGRVRDVLALADGAVVAQKQLTLSLTWDHRAFDGVPAAEFCRTIVGLLGDPAALDQ